MKRFFGFVLIALLGACGSSDEKAKVEEVKQGPLSQSKNSAAFNRSFDKLMDDYFHLKDNFITESDTMITAYTSKLLADADSLNLKELKADSNVVNTAKSFTESISAELKALSAEKTLDEKRKSFQMVSDQLFDLARAVQYDTKTIYQQNCPMAFGDVGANWLSKTSDIKNPYLPKKMLTCGEVRDSVGYKK